MKRDIQQIPNQTTPAQTPNGTLTARPKVSMTRHFPDALVVQTRWFRFWVPRQEVSFTFINRLQLRRARFIGARRRVGRNLSAGVEFPSERSARRSRLNRSVRPHPRAGRKDGNHIALAPADAECASLTRPASGGGGLKPREVQNQPRPRTFTKGLGTRDIVPAFVLSTASSTGTSFTFTT